MSEILEYIKVLGMIWNHKVFAVQGVKLSLGNITTALILLGFSKRFSKIVSHWVMKKLVIPFVDDKSAVSTYQKLVHTSVFSMFVVVALTFAGIPLTIFTVIGGALAIGIGFGSQNIVNNFISGLILMVERPLKIGDIVEINGIAGTIVEIGTRATRIRTPESKVWIIPNSTFLENPMQNWTNDDAIVRTEVTVGVAYGSNTEVVKKLSLDILSKMDFVQQSPRPRVMFDDFGDNSLIFKLQFWADSDQVESMQFCRSEVRYAVESAFRAANIEISFPQRDLHLRSAIPLEIKMRS
ncbi:MAG: mechanosensitive ion channel [Bacteriovoracaceae bacterium]|nr:mechanosensitive ion channel [Bacteriovoracaceae bacterium]